ncbi:MAG: bifunctional riboflavin kinase/FAD synthetase [Leucobacter sp.]
MQVISSLEALKSADFPQGSVVAVGKFDGVHLGHRAIIGSLQREASEHGLASVVFTFTNNPLSFLNPSACPEPLSSPAQRLELLEAAGVEYCVMVDFDEEFSLITAREFIDELLVDRLHVRHVILGGDFRFGHKGLGDDELLRAIGAERGFTVEVVENVNDVARGAVSSSRIREAVRVGDVALAGEMLGRPYSVRGTVVHGDARGRELGFPTANLGGDVEGLVPADGVYAGTVVIDGSEYLAAISVGVNLTFDPNGTPRVEAFVLDFDADLYGKQIVVRFVERIRPMLPFESAGALVDRMHDDVTETRELFKNR